MDMSWPRRVTAACATKTTASMTVAGIVVFTLAGGGKREESIFDRWVFCCNKKICFGGMIWWFSTICLLLVVDIYRWWNLQTIFFVFFTLKLGVSWSNWTHIFFKGVETTNTYFYRGKDGGLDHFPFPLTNDRSFSIWCWIFVNIHDIKHSPWASYFRMRVAPFPAIVTTRV